ncbi:unnamed protein product [Pleuronectes platessa]|uniref:Transmembrane protein n=1 Tax=Pleuronectes platessa TaxID=8262 RepID=A0A9N7YA25_PLEPL|nr:unnamed protein product [Pleuronectes platessa]
MPGKRNKRRVFLERLGKALVAPYIARRERVPRTEASGRPSGPNPAATRTKTATTTATTPGSGLLSSPGRRRRHGLRGSPARREQEEEVSDMPQEQGPLEYERLTAGSVQSRESFSYKRNNKNVFIFFSFSFSFFFFFFSFSSPSKNSLECTTLAAGSVQPRKSKGHRDPDRQATALMSHRPYVFASLLFFSFSFSFFSFFFFSSPSKHRLEDTTRVTGQARLRESQGHGDADGRDGPQRERPRKPLSASLRVSET